MTDAQQRETRLLLEFASKVAEQFVSLYYSATDSPSRSQLIPTLYSNESTILWNGNPIAGVTALLEMLNQMPLSHYEVHSADCQPMGGGREAAGGNLGDTSAPIKTPSLLLTVSGVVTHHTTTSHTAKPPTNAPASSNNANRTGFDSSLPLDSLPRAFSQNFVLVDDPQQTGQGGVVVSLDGSQNNASNTGGGKGGQAPQVAQGSLTGRYLVLADQFRFTG